MKLKPSILQIFAVLLLFPAMSYAIETKIGYVDTVKVLKLAPQADAVDEQLESEFALRKSTIIEKAKELKALESKLEKQGRVMGKSARRKLELDIRLSASQLKFENQEYRDDHNIRRNEAVRRLQTTVRGAINAVGKTDGYDLILSNGVMYSSTRVDLTQKVLLKLKADFKQQPVKK
ncbi:MAG: OmpH family outer membrane protein [Gammaproteobacteria bacterium]|nr:OmpH family outer membrane protein [Gammaproteobacteria bacterium]